MAARIAFEIVVLLVLILANGLFAMSEIAVISSRKARLQELARRGRRGAATALRLAESPDRFLSTVQVGITLIGVFAGAFGGATLAEEIAGRVETVPSLAPYGETIGVAVVVLAITYLSLILGELVPKRAALNAPERIATLVAPPMALLSRVAAPAVAVLTASTRLVMRALRVHEPQEAPVTEEELKALVRLGAKAGTIEPEERTIVERAFRLADRRVTSVMTPRVELEWLDLGRPLEELQGQVAASAHGWFPVAEGRVDHVSGVVRGRELWSPAVRDRGLGAAVQQPLFVPEGMPALAVLQRFRETGVHLAVVIDEFGGVEGIVTPTDLLEALVGELPEAGVDEGPMIVTREDGSWSVDATTDLAELELVIGLDRLAGQKSAYQTVGGFVADHLGTGATIGRWFVVDRVRFEVLDTDGRRIDRVLVSREPAATAATPSDQSR